MVVTVAIFAMIGGSSLPAVAQEALEGWYISGVAGLNFMQNESIEGVNRLTTNNTNVQTNVGGMGALGGGYAFGNGFRTELQINYRYNGLKSITSPRGNSASFQNNNGGSEQKSGPMPTLYYDFYGVSPAYVPYVGVGVGYQASERSWTSITFL